MTTEIEIDDFTIEYSWYQGRVCIEEIRDKDDKALNLEAWKISLLATAIEQENLEPISVARH